MSDVGKRRCGGSPFGPFHGVGRPRTFNQQARYSPDIIQANFVPPVIPDGSLNVVTASAASASGITLNKPTNTSDGDVLVAIVYGSITSATWTPPSGWSIVQTYNASRSLCLLTKPIPSAAAESATDYTFNQSGGAGRMLGILNRLVGSPTSGIVDVIGSPTAGSAGAILLPSITPGAEKSLLLGIWGCTDSATPITLAAPAGMTEVAEVNVNPAATSSLMIAYEVLTSNAATGTRTATTTPTNNSSIGGFLVNFSPGQPLSQPLLVEGWGMPIY